MPVALRRRGAVAGSSRGMPALDCRVLHGHPNKLSLREAAAWGIIWLPLGLALTSRLRIWQGGGAVSNYSTGYLLRQKLSGHNLLVFALRFAGLVASAAYLKSHHRRWSPAASYPWIRLFVVRGVRRSALSVPGISPSRLNHSIHGGEQ